MTPSLIAGLKDATASAVARIRDSTPAVVAAYEQRRKYLVGVIEQTGLHKELRNRARAQLLLLDVTGEQWQALFTSTADRIETLQKNQTRLLANAPATVAAVGERLAAAQKKADPSDAKSQADAKWLKTVSSITLDMTSVGSWLGPWTEALVSQQLADAQESYREVLVASDSRVAKAVAIAAVKKGIDFVPIIGPILTGTSDVYDLANTRAKQVETASDELTRMDDYMDALRKMALLFEALFASPGQAGNGMTMPDAAELHARITAREKRILASQTQ